MTRTASPPLQVEQGDGLLQLTLNRPDSANALNPGLTEALIETLDRADDVRLCVLRGAGRHFCAGFDLSGLESMSDGDLLWRFLRIETLLQAVHHAPFPVVAFGHGQLVGAGADLFAACWRRVAAADARFRMPGWNFELALGTRRLTHRIGQDAARDLLIDTRVLSAGESLACGLATDLAPQEEWPALSAELKQRASTLSPRAMQQMLGLTTRDSRSEDLAAIVQTAGRPGLRDRILAYRDRVKASAAD
ncbi:MAG: enoyl-CoA hydratase/isomerase family protein [Gammaproteobacteria bacterium]|nr:enoyl-CoA hydratase/isomerase family protein [Gammaproteobacteria bacterium]